MDDQAMLTRDLVLRVCASATELDHGWIRQRRKIAAPFTAVRDNRLVERIIAAGEAMGVERLLVCRTRGEFAYEPVTQIKPELSALLALIRSWGREPTDFLVAVEDFSSAVLVTSSRLTVAAGDAEFIRTFVGTDIAQAREDFADEAKKSRDPALIEAAQRYDCLETGRLHAKNRGPGPDLAERQATLAEKLRTGSSRRVAAYRSLRGAWGWAMVIALLVAAANVSSLAALAPLTVAMLWLLTQLFWLARSRTVSFAALPRMLALGALMAVPIALAERAAAGAMGLAYADAFAYAYVAVPVEEAGKLAPLLLLWLVARRRFKRFAAVDYALLAAAAGAGFHLAEQAVRLVVFHGVDGLVPPDAGFFTLLPGAVDLPFHDVRFSGHGVTTGLVGAALGLAAVGWRRYGAWLWVLPPVALWIAALEHLNYNAAIVALDREPLTQFLFGLFGNGSATRWLLLLLLVLAVLMDYRVARPATQEVPPLPGWAPFAGLARRAHGRAIRMNVRIPGDIVSGFQRVARVWVRLPVILVETLAEICHEFAVQAAAASRGPAALCESWRFLRQRREYAMGAGRASGRPWRHYPPRSALVEAGARLSSMLDSGAKAALAAAGAVVLASPALLLGEAHGGGVPAAYAAITMDAAADWYGGLAAAERWWAAVAVAAVLSLLVSGWTVPRVFPRAEKFLRGPYRQIGKGLGALAPGQVPYALAALVGTAIPRGADRLLRPSRPEPKTTHKYP